MENTRREFLRLFGGAAFSAGFLSSGDSCEAPYGESPDWDLSGIPATWKEIRDRFFTLSSDYIYMNNSTLGPTLKPVAKRIAAVRNIFSKGCYLDEFVYEIILRLAPLRERLRRLINGYDDGSGKGRCIGLVDSVTEGMSLVANGLSFRAGDVILTTDHEHTGGFTMWELQRDRYGAQIVQIPLIIPGQPEGEWKAGLLQRFEAALKLNDVKVLSFSWITTSTGHVLPAKEICELASSYGAISVIDAAQAFAVLPMDVTELGCDFLVANGHKYLCGPVGSGFICIHPRMLEDVSAFWPTVVDDNYYHPGNPAIHSPHRKGGVMAYTTVLPLDNGLSFYERLGSRRVHKRLLAIGRNLRNWLSLYPNHFEVVTPAAEDLSCVMTCFKAKNLPSEEVYRILRDKYRIHVKHSTEGDADTVRISPHYYTTAGEISRLTSALSDIAGMRD